MLSPLLNEKQKASVLAEVNDLIQSMPDFKAFNDGDLEALGWLGRTSGAVRYALVATSDLDFAIRDVQSHAGFIRHESRHAAYKQLLVILHQLRSMLRLDLNQLSVMIPSGRVFEYFDEIRRLVASSRTELFFVDPYLDADFVSRYLVHAVPEVPIRLLTGTGKLKTLLSAVDMFAAQSARKIAVRSSTELHDRFMFVDKRECHQSGASFKDGAKNAPTLVAQLVDPFSALWETYDALWTAAKRER